MNEHIFKPGKSSIWSVGTFSNIGKIIFFHLYTVKYLVVLILESKFFSKFYNMAMTKNRSLMLCGLRENRWAESLGITQVALKILDTNKNSTYLIRYL